MKCRKCKQLIHGMLDGEVNQQEKREVGTHLKTCEDCRSYYHDMVQIGAALREPDRVPPPDFQQKWKQQLAAAAAEPASQARRTRPRRRFRPAVLIPVVACCVAAMFVVSTLMVNPQAFGLEGESVTGEWFAAIMPAVGTATPSVDPGSGQKVSFVATSEKKPNLLDFENSEYSEITTSSQLPQLSAEGTIEPQHNEVLGSIQDAIDEHGRSLPEELPVLTLSVSEEELDRLREAAAGLDITVLSDDESGILFEGSPEQIVEIASGYSLELPEEAGLIRLHCSN